MDLKLLYGPNADLNYYEDRIEALKRTFIENEGVTPDCLFS